MGNTEEIRMKAMEMSLAYFTVCAEAGMTFDEIEVIDFASKIFNFLQNRIS